MSGLTNIVKSTKSAAIICPPKECWEQIQEIRSKHDKAYQRWMPHINLLFPFIEDSGNAFEMAATSLAKKLANVSAFRVSFTAESFGHFNHGRNATLWLKPLVAQCSDSATAKPADAEDKLKSKKKSSDSTEPSLDNLGDAFWKPGDGDHRVIDGLVGHSSVSGDPPKSDEPPRANRTDETPGATHESGSHASVFEIESILRNTFPQLDDQVKKGHGGFHPHLTLGQFPTREIEKVILEFQKNWTDITFDVGHIFLISRKDFNDPFHVRQTVPLGMFDNL